MKAAVVVGYNDIVYKDIPNEKLNNGEIKIAVKHCGICGSDIPRVLQGACHSFPQVLGHEFSGVVVDKAEDVKSIPIGQHVVGIPLIPCMKCEDCQRGHFSLCKNYSFIGSRQQGAMAEYVNVPVSNVFKLDSSIPLSSAALFEPSTIALHGIMLNNYSPKTNEYTCIFGAGTIALLTLQWCRIMGAKNIVVIGRNKSNLEKARGYGASFTISTLDVDYLEQINKVTSNKGFQYVFEAAGSAETIMDCLSVASNKAHICFIGTPTKPLNIPIKLWELINRKELMITGSWMSYSYPWPGLEWEKTAQYMSSGQLVIDDNLVHAHYPLSEIKNVFHLYENNRTSINGRIIIDI